MLVALLVSAGLGAGHASAQASAPVAAQAGTPGSCPALLRHSFTPIQGGTPHSLCQYSGKVVVVVNTATNCGFAYQYEGLEALYRKYRDRGLVVVGFPSNDFGGQEPRANNEIAEYCRTVYGVQFPMFEKATGGKLASTPFYTELAQKSGHTIKWNFNKYVIDRRGERVAGFVSDVKPESREFTGLIEKLLAEKV